MAPRLSQHCWSVGWVLGPGLVWSLAEPPLGPVSVPVESLMALALALARVRLRQAVVRGPEWLARVSLQQGGLPHPH
jgi:hypothetical protein